MAKNKTLLKKMPPNKLFKLIDHLDKSDLKEIGKMLSSPFFVGKQRRSKLIFELITQKGIYDKELLYQKANEKKDVNGRVSSPSFDANRLNIEFNTIVKVIEQYFFWKNRDTAAYHRSIAQGYHSKDLIGYKFEHLDRGIKLIEQKELLNEQEHHTLYCLYQEKYLNLYDAYTEEAKDIFHKMSIQYFASIGLNGLKYQAQKVFRTLILDEDFEEGIAEKSPFYQFNLNLRNFLKVENKELTIFQSIISEFKSICGLLNEENKYTFLYSLLNIAIQESNAGGDTSFLKLQFELYQFGLDEGILLQKDQITVRTFQNILLTATKLKEFDFAESFINRFASFLPRKTKEETIDFCNAYLYFNKKEFEKAIRILSTAKHKQPDSFLKLAAMEIQCLFEFMLQGDNNYNTLVSRCKSLRKKLAKIDNYADAKIDTYKAFTESVEGLAEYFILDIYQSNDIVIIKQRLESNERFAFKNWLQQKLIEVLQKKQGSHSLPL